MNRYRLIYTLLLTALLAGGSITSMAQVTIGGSVYGGGEGETTLVQGTVTVNIGKKVGTTLSGSATIEGDVYGGSAKGKVNVTKGGTDESPTYTATSGKATQVNIYGCTSINNVYGGGLGDNTPDSEIAADVYGPVTVTVEMAAGTINEVFGCNNLYGSPQSTVAVIVNKTKAHTPAAGENPAVFAIQGVYGGGDRANYVASGAPTVTINDCASSVKDVFGGGNAAAVPATSVTVNGGIIDRVFAGGNGQVSAANVTGNASAVIHGGTINKIFTGSNTSGTIGGTPSLTIDKTGTCEMHLAEVYGGGNEAPSKAGTISIACTGGEGEGIGDVYGGANAADIGTEDNPSNITLNITGGSINRVFGGNNTSGTIYGTITVNVNWATGEGACGTNYLGSVFGGGNLASYIGSPAVNIINGTVSENVYGGGNQAGVGGSSVSITGGSVLGGIYGGCNTSGTVTGDITVDILANVGASGTGNSVNIFGGGYGAATRTNGNVTVTIGKEDGTSTPTIYGDIYGGSALGNVNDDNDADEDGNADDLTKIDFLNGTLHGNIYGGGLGDKASLNSGEDTSHSDVEAKVYGRVEVNISSSTQTAGNCHIDLRDANIYGCNNTNGSPQDNVTVNIYKTAYNYSDYATGDKYTASYTQDEGDPDPAYAINQVFGGGNQADYEPAASTKKARVNIIGCNNTIRRVFGGGNAAAATGVATTISGGRFDYIFGGGNGEVSAANIGTGGIGLTVNSGIINHLFGGGNKNGLITGPMTVAVDNTGCSEVIKEFFAGANEATIGDSEHPVNLSTTIACGTVFDEVYGGSNLANIYGNVTLTINGGTIGTVYAGSKGRAEASGVTAQAANINGNTTLNIYGGAIGNAFGGSNINGNITGSIIVNMDWSQSECTDKSMGNIYGASNLATYTPTNASGAYPEVNIKHGTVTNSVFGGGKGDPSDPSKGVVTSCPKVTIGDDNADHYAVVTENVYGGGDAAAVTGSTTVIYDDSHTSSQVARLFGGGNAADVSGQVNVTLTNGKVITGVYGGCNDTGSVGNVVMSLTGGTVGVDGTTTDVVYGGGYGHNTSTTGNIGITLGATTVYGNFYGGSALGQVNASTSNTTTLTINGSNLHGIIFGGGMGTGSGDATRATSNGNVQIDYNTANTNLTGLYGGANVNGHVTGAITVNVKNNVGAAAVGEESDPGYVAENRIDIFGGGFGENTSTGSNVTVYIGDDTNTSSPIVYSDVYGGSSKGQVNDATACDADGNPTNTTTVNILSGTINGDIFGGGLGEANVYSGETLTTDNSSKGQVNGNVVVNIGKAPASSISNPARGVRRGEGDEDDDPYIGFATINGSVYGCNNTNGSPKGSVEVNIYRTAHTPENEADYSGGDATYAIASVFGGGNMANQSSTNTTKCKVHVHGCHNTIEDLFGGGNAAETLGVITEVDGGRFDRVFGGGNGEDTPANITSTGTSLIIHGGNIKQLFGGSNERGSITGGMSVSVDATGPCASTRMHIADFFCGNNRADLTSDINTIIGCGTSFGNVYGGCNLADITGNVSLTIIGGEMDNVFGGSKGDLARLNETLGETGHTDKPANISGNVTLNIYGGTIGNAFGGSDVNGNINGTITVNMIDLDGSCGFTVNNVYGAGRDAAYTPNFTPSSGSDRISPVVNIIHGTVSKNAEGDGTDGNVFGGGLGTGAVVTSNPKVNVGYDASTMSGYLPDDETLELDLFTEYSLPSTYSVEVEGDVFGGGDAAQVSGYTNVTVNEGTIKQSVFGGGNNAAVTGNTTVNLYNGTIEGDVFGGGNQGVVNGSATVNIEEK